MMFSTYQHTATSLFGPYNEGSGIHSWLNNLKVDMTALLPTVLALYEDSSF